MTRFEVYEFERILSQRKKDAENMRKAMNLENYYRTPTILFWLKDPTPQDSRCKIFSVSERQALDKGLPLKGLLQDGKDDEIELYAREWLMDVATLPDDFILVSVFLKVDGMWYFNIHHPSYVIGINEPEPLFEYHYTPPDKVTEPLPTGMSSLDETPEI